MNERIEKLIEVEPLVLRWPLLKHIDNCPDHINLTIKRYGAEEFIFYGGEELHYVYWILQGQVKCGVNSILADPHTFITIGEGKGFGHYEAVCGVKKYYADIISLGNTVILSMDAHDYIRWLKSDPDLMFWSFQESVRDLLQQNFSSHLIRFLPSEKRLQIFLCNYFEFNAKKSYFADPEKYLLIPFTQDAIAQELGISLRTLARRLKELTEDGLVARDRGKILINANQVRQLKEKVQSAEFE